MAPAEQWNYICLAVLKFEAGGVRDLLVLDLPLIFAVDGFFGTFRFTRKYRPLRAEDTICSLRLPSSKCAGLF